MDKPLVTLCIFAYKAESYIAETIKGALNQTYDNLEIIISDDCSPDETYKIIKDTVSGYKGKHSVKIYRNESNLGMIKHLNLLFKKAEGSIVATNPGDDISYPSRIEDTVAYFSNPKVQMVTFSRENIDKDGVSKGYVRVETDKYIGLDKDYLKTPSFMRGGTGVAFRKKIIDVFGLLNEDAQTEDSTLRFRSLMMGEIIYSSKIGVKYRIHGDNMSLGVAQYKLKTELIANQYKRDLCIAYEKKLINNILLKKLGKKIDYFKTFRSLCEKRDKTKSLILVCFYRIKIRLVSLTYRFTI